MQTVTSNLRSRAADTGMMRASQLPCLSGAQKRCLRAAYLQAIPAVLAASGGDRTAQPVFFAADTIIAATSEDRGGYGDWPETVAGFSATTFTGVKHSGSHSGASGGAAFDHRATGQSASAGKLVAANLHRGKAGVGF